MVGFAYDVKDKIKENRKMEAWKLLSVIILLRGTETVIVNPRYF